MPMPLRSLTSRCVCSRVWAARTSGGKGANLGELTSAGLPVPAGFVVGAPTYAAFCAQTGLRERLAELLDGVDVEDTAVLQATSMAARELFERRAARRGLE